MVAYLAMMSATKTVAHWVDSLDPPSEPTLVVQWDGEMAELSANRSVEQMVFLSVGSMDVPMVGWSVHRWVAYSAAPKEMKSVERWADHLVRYSVAQLGD
jgi:hypothetical protein